MSVRSHLLYQHDKVFKKSLFNCSVDAHERKRSCNANKQV